MTATNKPRPTAAAIRKARAAYAAKLLAAREKKKWTQEDLAARLDVHVNTVRNTERTGRASPMVAQALAAVLSVNPLPRYKRA